MNLNFAYHGRSQVTSSAAGQTIALAPDLGRAAVSFDAPLTKVRLFREAISTLHDVVISDLRFKKRDKAAYLEWKKQEEYRIAQVRHGAYTTAKTGVTAQAPHPIRPDLENEHRSANVRYWNARKKFSDYLQKHDAALWRKLWPYDPVITVANDVLFFECFSADESSYGCLTAERDECFGRSDNTRLGTTNVDYSWDLYDHFQTLRTYREARFRVDPTGFEVDVQGGAMHREEKIDLPNGWLRGFMQLQGAMTMPMRRLSLSPQAMYSLLAWFRRHKPNRSPRALRFEMVEGRPPELVIEPWETRIVDRAAPLCAESCEAIRVWGTRRLLALARVLPIADRFEVRLLGTGLPSFWIAHMGPLKLTLGLSGWTANDWTRGSALDLLAPPSEPSEDLIRLLATQLESSQSASLQSLCQSTNQAPAMVNAALRKLAHTGQVIHDLPHEIFRWRQILPQALGEAQLGPENAELVASRELLKKAKITLQSTADTTAGKAYVGLVDNRPVELLLDADGAIRRGKCNCSHHYTGGLRRGPCRHLLVMRAFVRRGVDTATTNWYERWWSKPA